MRRLKKLFSAFPRIPGFLRSPMPKLIAPHGASWRGRALDAGDIIDVAESEAAALTAHGFREVEQDSTGTAGVTGTVDVPSASGLSGNTDADKMSAVPVTVPVPRKDLLKLLKGRGLGNLFVKSTEELRALAAVVLAGEAIVEAGNGHE
jgi:hypothetical protein